MHNPWLLAQLLVALLLSLSLYAARRPLARSFRVLSLGLRSSQLKARCEIYINRSLDPNVPPFCDGPGSRQAAFFTCLDATEQQQQHRATKA
jgi:hypothetical protein